MPIEIQPFGIAGGNGSDAVTYTIGAVDNTMTVDTAKIKEIAGVANSERVRRTGTANYVDINRFTGNIESADLTAITDALSTAPYPYAISTTGIAQTQVIYASHINTIINGIVAAGAVCLCNCNYCTCNCNYCTCNCNYSCTCNCNYSDERLKTNIRLLGTEEGLNVYSWSYLWDCTKTYVGVIAQELLGTKFESALATDARGYYMVDYSKLPIKMKEA